MAAMVIKSPRQELASSGTARSSARAIDSAVPASAPAIPIRTKNDPLSPKSRRLRAFS